MKSEQLSLVLETRSYRCRLCVRRPTKKKAAPEGAAWSRICCLLLLPHFERVEKVGAQRLLINRAHYAEHKHFTFVTNLF